MPECKPPNGTKELTYHWIFRERLHPAMWWSGGWLLCGRNKAIAHDQINGWTYIAPCVEPETR